MSPEAAAALDTLCEQLARATSARKVLICAPDGQILAHVGRPGLFTARLSSALASLVADLLIDLSLLPLPGAASGPGAPSDHSPLALKVDDHFTHVGALRICATALDAQALLLVLFDAQVAAGLVRVRVRRARRGLLSVLCGGTEPGD